MEGVIRCCVGCCSVRVMPVQGLFACSSAWCAYSCAACELVLLPKAEVVHLSELIRQALPTYRHRCVWYDHVARCHHFADSCSLLPIDACKARKAQIYFTGEQQTLAFALCCHADVSLIDASIVLTAVARKDVSRTSYTTETPTQKGAFLCITEMSNAQVSSVQPRKLRETCSRRGESSKYWYVVAS
eukprot:6209038-Pleurochrysis_carterae.AAC.5